MNVIEIAEAQCKSLEDQCDNSEKIDGPDEAYIMIKVNKTARGKTVVVAKGLRGEVVQWGEKNRMPTVARVMTKDVRKHIAATRSAIEAFKAEQEQTVDNIVRW